MPSRRGQITDTLRASIIGGELDPGVTYSAPVLAAQFGVSPTPVREAMLHLAKEGLIEVVRNKGFRVIEPSEKALDEILELRNLLEIPTVGEIAARGISDSDVADLKILAQTTVDAAKANDIPEHVQADIEFHSTLLAIRGNSQLVELVRLLRSRSRSFGLSSPRKAGTLISSSREHLQLVKLVAAKDRKGAEKLMRQHLAHTRTDWRKPAAN
jgi:DNA-binding GntR family transcriptional regulator